MLHGLGGSEADIHQQLDRFLPAVQGHSAAAFVTLKDLAVRVAENRGELSIWGAPFFVSFAMRFFSAAAQALSFVFGSEGRRPFFWAMAVDFWLVLVTTFLFAGNALVSSLEAMIPGLAGRVFAVSSAFSFGMLLFFVVYTVAPDRRIRWDTALIASAVAALSFELAKRLFGLYLTNFATLDRLLSNANVIAVLLILAWFYYMALSFLVAAEIAHQYDLVRKRVELAVRT